ncbi:ABC transporter substrate-binding protein [Bacillus sp. N9]
MDNMPEFTIVYNTSEGHKKIAEAVQEMWRKNLDVKVNLENVEFQVKLDREKAGDYEISVGLGG